MLNRGSQLTMFFLHNVSELLQMLQVLKEHSHPIDDSVNFSHLIFWRTYPGVKIFVPTQEYHTGSMDDNQPDIGDTISTNSDDSPLEIYFLPCIKGSGWPGGLQIQHAFPRQKPFVTKGTDSLRALADLVEDGQGHALWVLDPAFLNQQSHDSPRASRLHKTHRSEINSEEKSCWRVSLKPALIRLKRDLIDGLSDTELNRKVNIEQIHSVILYLRVKHDWTSLTDDVIDSAILWTVKRHLPNTRSTGMMFMKVMHYLQNAAQLLSCPCFWRPNLNIFPACTHQDTTMIAQSISEFYSQVEKDETYFLKYLGYKTRTELEKERRQQLCSHIKNTKVKSAVTLLNKKKHDIYA